MSFLDNFKNISMIFGGISLLMFAMSTIGSFVKPLVNMDKLKVILGKYTKNRFVSSLIGFVCTAIMQSAGATTMIVSDFANNGILGVLSAMSFVIGSSVGTTIKGFFPVLSISNYVITLSFIMTIVLLITKNKKLKDISKLVFIVSLFFIGPSITKIYFKKYVNSFDNLFKFLNNFPFIGILIGFVFGTIFCSSSALTAVLQVVYCNSPILNFYAVLYLIFGVNVGSTVTSLIASLNGEIYGKKVVFVKFITRALTVIPAIVITLIFKNKLVEIVGSSNSFDGNLQIALAHFAFNLLSAIIFVPLLPYLVKVLDILIFNSKKKNEKETNKLGEKKTTD